MQSAIINFPNLVERDRLVSENQALVKFCVNSLHGRNGHSDFDYEDLLSCGMVGLVQAANRFDGSQGVKFSNFAVPRIRGAIIDAMRGFDPVGRSSRHTSKRIAELFNDLALELGRNPTDSEVQAALGIGEGQYWAAKTVAGFKMVSLDLPVREGLSLAECLQDDASEVSDNIETRERTAALADAIAHLSERDQLVLSLYYIEGLTMKEVARTMGISETRVSQLLARSCSRLRDNRRLASAV